ncbi:MAG: glycine/sarcosine/betaine reductase component B subunit [Actinomycetota bacterium]
MPRPGTISASPLTVAAFDVRAVREVRHGEGRVSRTPGDPLLEIDLDVVESLCSDEPALGSLRAHVVRPGDSVRIANVLDAVVPSVKADDPAATFPGVLGPADALCGTGRTDRLDGIAVLSTLDMGALIDPDDPIPASYVDMDGSGASLTPWGSTINLVLELVAAQGASLADVDAAARRTLLRAARDLASATAEDSDADTESVFALGEVAGELPVVVPILQFTAEGPGLTTYLRGAPVDLVSPCAVDPRALLDGALTAGAYDSPAARVSTGTIQRSRLLHRLLNEHGTALVCPGAVLTQGYLDDADDKRRMADGAAHIAAEELGADAAICTTYSLGNSHTDTMLTLRACEQLGVRAVGIVAEEGGLTDHVAEADALVSTGNVLERADGWTPASVIGETDHEAPAQVPVLHYLDAATQLGDGRLRGVTI